MADTQTKSGQGMDALDDFLSNSAFIKFEDTNPVEGIYQGCRIEDDPFNPGKPRMVYAIEIEGDPKSLSSSSKRLAKQFKAKNPVTGSFIKITQTGTGFDTNYTLEVGPDGIPF